MGRLVSDESEFYPVLPTLETRGHGCQFHHLTVLSTPVAQCTLRL